ncbi:cellulose binding domain-containing protein [Micromonospora sp. NPDC051006]|uniref:cellulose binding domain-containing protein n=1 Tax=Micromonospora sp. NPDC051006 TaxID=3364283 RepID=UPI0037A9D5AC
MSGTSRAPRPSHGRAIASSPWIVVFAGVVVMVVLLLVALSAYRGRSPAAQLPPGPNPAVPLPAPSTAGPSPSPSPSATRSVTVPSRSPRPSGPAATIRAGSTSPTGPPPAAAPRGSVPPPSPPVVTGRYQVDQTFDGGFIGTVLITNASGSARAWTVRLTFSGGRVVTAWVAGAPQGTLRATDDGGYTYTGGVDVAAGASARLQFHVERASTRPVLCTVNDAGCAGL